MCPGTPDPNSPPSSTRDTTPNASNSIMPVMAKHSSKLAKPSKKVRYVSEYSENDSDASVASASSVEEEVVVKSSKKKSSRSSRAVAPEAETRKRRLRRSARSGGKKVKKSRRVIIAEDTDTASSSAGSEVEEVEEEDEDVVVEAEVESKVVVKEERMDVDEVATPAQAADDKADVKADTTMTDTLVSHVPKFGVNAGKAISLPEPVVPAAQSEQSKIELAGSGVNLDISQIHDLSVTSAERMKEVTTFQLGSGYFVRIGPTPFHAQGGTYDAICFGKVIIEKEGGKPKPVSVNISIKSAPQLVEGLNSLRTQFETGREPLTLQDLMDLKAAASSGKDIELADRLQFVAPKQGFRIDNNHLIAGETVTINKNSSYEAITFCRLPKTAGANGKPTKKFSLSYPLRFLPTLTVLGEYALKLWLNETPKTDEAE